MTRQHDPSSRPSWDVARAWAGLRTGLAGAGYATQTVRGLGAGAVLAPVLGEAAVLEKPTAIVVLVYTVARKQTSLSSVRSAMKTVLTHF